MAIDRALGAEMPSPDESNLEIVIENPESVGIFDEDGGMMIDFDSDATALLGAQHDSNLVDYLSDGELDSLSAELTLCCPKRLFASKRKPSKRCTPLAALSRPLLWASSTTKRASRRTAYRIT